MAMEIELLKFYLFISSALRPSKQFWSFQDVTSNSMELLAYIEINGPQYEKTGLLHMRKQRRR